ncbi:immunity 52 family protein, partial [Enterobacter hormaechei]|nr:immunity 52 family protein [Enterobacter hormaechei]
VYIFKAMVNYNGWCFKYILLDTEQYRFNQREVFDDRLPVGWMLYLPVRIKHEHVPSAYKVFDIENNAGTIVVSKSVFNGKEPFDITCANNVEIELAANGLLPLIKGL